MPEDVCRLEPDPVSNWYFNRTNMNNSVNVPECPKDAHPIVAWCSGRKVLAPMKAHGSRVKATGAGAQLYAVAEVVPSPSWINWDLVAGTLLGVICALGGVALTIYSTTPAFHTAVP